MGRTGGRAVEVVVGWAAGAQGAGVAYAGLGEVGNRAVLRLIFRTASKAPTAERASAYAALATAARALLRRGIRRVQFVVADSQFVGEVTTRCELPDTLSLAYVRLRCALNAFDEFGIQCGPTDELTQRARAEVALNCAA